jgi:hypothetical protein
VVFLICSAAPFYGKILRKMIRNPGPQMTATARKLKHKPALKTFYATMLVTRAEQWWVEAETAEEAQALLAAGQGHHCHGGERVYFELDTILDEAG